MAVLRNIKITAKHDIGSNSITMPETSIAKAVSRFCELCNCPENAITSIKCTDIPVQYYKVIRFFKKSGKKVILHTNKTREQADNLVARYPSNPGKSFVGREKQRSRYSISK